jgi:hypothetical protein
MGRKYYSQRNGNTSSSGLSLECVDAEEPTIGKLGRKPEVSITLDLKKGKLYPISLFLSDYSEDDLFDMIEYLYDHVSKPVETENTPFHSYNGCGFHYDTFDKTEGQKVFAERINRLLESYGEGFELNEAAKNKFLRSRSSLDGRRDAIRDLADVFENLKSSGLLKLNKKDESDIFNIANNFGIRHFDTKQKTDYDEAIWLSWMFHFYLATIHACLRLQERSSSQ